MKRITIDIDNKKPKPYSITSAHDITRILYKIKSCPNSQTIECQMSPSMNGYHIIVWCTARNCNACRMVFDDQVRFMNDTNLRQEHQQNILFDTYTLYPRRDTIKGNHKPITL